MKANTVRVRVSDEVKASLEKEAKDQKTTISEIARQKLQHVKVEIRTTTKKGGK